MWQHVRSLADWYKSESSAFLFSNWSQIVVQHAKALAGFNTDNQLKQIYSDYIVS